MIWLLSCTALAKRVFFIILTDFLCWIPIIAIGIKSHVEKTFDPPGDLAVWIAVFALPINSAINPLLYTLSTPQVQAILKPKLRKLWSNVRSFFNRGQNQEEEADNDQQGQAGNEDAHAINEEGEHIEMQVIEHHDIPEMEALELLAPQPVTVHHGESQYRQRRPKEVQEGKSKPEPKKPAGKAGESEEQVESEEIAGPSDKGQEGESKPEPAKRTEKAGKCEEQVKREEIPGTSDKGQEGESKPEPAKRTEKAGESEEQVASVEIPVPGDKIEEEKALKPDMDFTKEGEEDMFDTRP
ncbi:Relaxin receptor 1 [Stylophora pistillata]|uniref:Relaxin receptor 1 n=1 Tax=Stylophora pistillata TaxID=50429 RepID=A0A2B4RB16_STYPI|nr:Relaxin receptor 1 [Stylophora pistillata]